MTIVELGQLQEQLSDLVTAVRDQHEVVFVSDQGKIIARILPPEVMPEEIEQSLVAFDEMDEIATEIGEHWPAEVSAIDAVNEQRR